MVAKLIKRTWTSRGPTGHRVKRVAWGYTLQVDGQQVRKFSSEWVTRDDAEKALAARQLGLVEDQALATAPMAFGEACDRYLADKAGKRSIEEDARLLKHLAGWFGKDTALAAITAARISEFKSARKKEISRQTGRALSAASINRSLALLRHLLRLAHDEWQVIPAVPRIKLEREAEGRLRFLSEEEIARLLAACARSRNPYLSAIVSIAVNTGMRKGEILGLAWERVDFSRGVILLDRTKSGKRREVPMNDAVYAALTTLPGDKVEGPVFRKANGAAWGEIRTAFVRACRESKIDDFRFHDLRHTFASHLVMRGRPLKEVQELLGHRSLAMTLRYSHLSPDRLRDAVAALDGLGSGCGQAVDRSAAKPADFSTKSAQRAQDRAPDEEACSRIS